jgi:hypothetical protein
MNKIILSFTAVLLALAGACATSDESGGQVVDRSEPVCFSDYDVRSFNPVDDEFIYVEGPRDAHYLLTMQRGCIGLRSASVIGIPDQPGRICANSMDDIIYRDIATGQASCRILDIERVMSRDEARELAQARKKARREQ